MNSNEAKPSEAQHELVGRCRSARQVVHDVMQAISGLEIKGSERTWVSLSLLLASMDTALASIHLLEEHPETSWVPALALQRIQIDYFLRGAYFARVASEREVTRFARRGKLPRRADVSGRKRDMFLNELAKEVASECGFGAKLENMVSGHWGPLSSLVHGGKEIVAIYSHKGELGNISVEPKELLPVIDNEIVLVMLSLALTMMLSPVPPAKVSEIVRDAYNSGTSFFADSLTT